MNAIVEKTGNENGYDYIVKFFEDGHRCGYVRVPEGHKFYDKFYGDIDIDCHGGLTFSRYVTERDEFNGLTPGFWIGFDCAHYTDGLDLEKSVEVFGENKFVDLRREYPFLNEGPVRDLDYVVNECFRSFIQRQKKQYPLNFTKKYLFVCYSLSTGNCSLFHC